MILIRDNVERVATNDGQIARLKAQGFVEVGGNASADSTEPQPVGDITKMTVSQLRDLAREKGIEGANALKKEELLEVLKDVIGA